MKASKLTRELRRIARREVPNGEPNLWPAIQQQLERAGASHEPRRSGADLSSSYVWHADAPKRRRFGTLPTALAGALVLVLLVAGLALTLGNRGDDETSVGLGSVLTPTTSDTTSATPTSIPSINVQVATPTTISSVLTCSNLSILTRFIDAFNANDQATLRAMLPETALGGNRWLAAVTTSHLNLMNGNLLAMTRDDFLSYVASRHQQHEHLSFEGVLETTQANTVPISENVVIRIERTADDIGVEHVKAVVSLSCAEQQITAWSVGDTLDTSGTVVPTGEDLISQTLHARDLHVNDIALSGGICPADLPHSVDPTLGPALGDGPLYVVMGQADENGVNHMDINNGWDYFKVLWTSDSSYQGPVLVRGMQIDGSGEMHFGDNNPPDPDLYFMAPHGNVAEVTYTRVNAPGCYAYQVDGINFSELIVTSFQP